MARQQECTVPEPPGDSISSVTWLSGSEVAIASWDCTVRLYAVDLGAPQLRSTYSHKAPVLCCAAGVERQTFSSGLDMAVRMHDFDSGSDRILGSHEGSVKGLVFASEQRALVSASWDKTMRVWDDRSNEPAVAKVSLPDKAYSLSSSGQSNLLVAATANRHICLYDIRRLGAAGSASSAVLSSRESSLKHQTRCAATFLDGSGWATASTEGRVAVDFVDESPAVQDTKYAFKCHRRKLPAGAAGTPEEEVFPVNALSVHPIYGTLATGGGDATVACWDWVAKKRLAAYSGYAQPITALAFSPDGTSLAIASSYDWQKGEQAAQPAALHIRTVPDAEVRPKTVQAQAQA